MNAILTVAVLLTVWAGSLYVHPFVRCHRCRGTGAARSPSGRRVGRCRWCRGKGRRQRFGSRTVHRTVWALRRDIAQERARTQSAGQTEDPIREEAGQ